MTQQVDPRQLKQNGAANGQAMVWDEILGQWKPGTVAAGWLDNIATIVFIFNGGDTVLAANENVDVTVDFSGVITEATLLADVSTTSVIDIWKDTFANFPPLNADSITASLPVSITASTKAKLTTLTGWNTTFSAGDIFRVNLDSNNSAKRLTLTLRVRRT